MTITTDGAVSIPVAGEMQDKINKMYLLTVAIFRGDWSSSVKDLVCTSKDMLKLKDLSTNTRVTDDPDQHVGVTDIFKSEGFDSIEIQFPTGIRQSVDMITRICENQDEGENYGYNVMFSYAGRPVLGISNVYIIGFEMGGGENNSSPDSIMRLQPSGRSMPLDLTNTSGGGDEYAPFTDAIAAWNTANGDTGGDDTGGDDTGG